MIVKMKKLYMVVMDSNRKEALKELARFGAVHVETENVESEQLSELRERRAEVIHAINILEELKSEGQKAHNEFNGDIDKLLQRITEHETRIENIDAQIENLLVKESEYSILGDFNPQDIAYLADKGIQIKLFSINKKDFKNLDAPMPIFVLKEAKSAMYCAAVSLDDFPEDFDVEEILPPEKSLHEMKTEIETLREERKSLIDELKTCIPKIKDLQEEQERLDANIEFLTVSDSMGVESSLAYLSGFIPEEVETDVKTKAAENGWGILIRDPTEQEQVPTLIRNPKWVQIIKPVYDLLGTVPGYRERDISMFFLIFLSIFVAMIIGDAGYGLLLILGSVIPMFGYAKKKKPLPDGFILLTVFGAMTFLWGMFSGTWFGARAIVENTPLSNLVIPAISSFNPKSSMPIKHICFILGTVQIAIAHFWNIIREFQVNKLRSLSQVGWFVMVLGLYYLVLNLVLDPQKYPMPNFALYMIIAGIVLVILFSQQQGNVLKGFLHGFGFSNLLTSLLDSINAFTDIISYIRLFAVGLATVEVAKSFNMMAANVGDGVIGIIGGILIIVIGHTLNMIMAALSVMVHGVRLNVLEFSSHLGMEWTGFQYKPFTTLPKEKKNAS